MLRQIFQLLTAGVDGQGRFKITGGAGGGGGAIDPTQTTVASAQAITSSLEQIGSDLDVSTQQFLGIQISNDGGGDLSALHIQVKSNDNANWITLFSQTSDYTSPPFGSPLKGASGNLTQLAAGTDGWVNLEVVYYTKVRLMAGTANGGTSLTIYAGGK